MNVKPLIMFTAACLLIGCTQNGNSDGAARSPAEDGWVNVGKVEVAQERDEDVVQASHVPGTYKSLRLEADGPAEIHRIIVTYHDSSVDLPGQMLKFDGPGSQVVPIAGSKKIDRVALVYSGGRLMRKTVVSLWVK